MSKIPIKVKKGKAVEKVAEEMKVDLRNELVKEQKQPSRKWLFLGILFLIIVILFISWLFFSQEKLPFTDLVPEEAVIFSLINQPEFYPQISSFNQSTINKLNDYFNQAQLNFQEDIQPLFKKQIAFILLPANNETALPFVLLLEKNSSKAQISHILTKIETKLKQDYNFSWQAYRQIEITVLKPIFSSPAVYAYSQLDSYFIISNSQESLGKVIDFIIDK